jgi:dihydroflavonol-4-reductase
MRICITGATGLLGANVAVRAREAGHDIVCTRRATSDTRVLDALDPVWIEAPLSDVDALTRAFDGCTHVVHCAARTSMLPTATPALVAANVTGTDHVVEACERAGVDRLLHVSSTVAVGVSTDGTPCDESSPWNLPEHGLDDGYATTKRQSEENVRNAVQDGRIDAVIVNPGFMFGAYDARPSSGEMILQVAKGNGRVTSPGRNSFCDARRVADGMLAALERGQSGERYILAGENLRYAEIFGRIAQVVGRPPPRLAVPHALARPVGWLGDLAQWWTGRDQPVTTMSLRWGYAEGFVASSDKAIRALGYDPGTPDEGIRAAWAWFQENTPS